MSDLPLTPPLIVPLTPPLMESVDSFVDRKRASLARVPLTHLQTINGRRSNPTNSRISSAIQTINGAINGHPHTPTPVDRKIVCVGGRIWSPADYPHHGRFWRPNSATFGNEKDA